MNDEVILVCAFLLGKPRIGTSMEAFWATLLIHSPIDFLAYRFILVYVALSDFHIGVMYNSGFFSLWPDSTVESIFAGHHC